eukprot:9346230-Pyramimonas_sp.AAC.1
MFASEVHMSPSRSTSEDRMLSAQPRPATSCAPIVDIPSGGTNHVRGERMFSAQPRLATSCAPIVDRPASLIVAAEGAVFANRNPQGGPVT